MPRAPDEAEHQPRDLHVCEGVDELRDLTRHDQVDDERDQGEPDENGAAPGALAVIAGGMGVDLGLRRALGLLVRHGTPFMVNEALARGWCAQIRPRHCISAPSSPRHRPDSPQKRRKREWSDAIATMAARLCQATLAASARR